MHACIELVDVGPLVGVLERDKSRLIMVSVAQSLKVSSPVVRVREVVNNAMKES